MKIQVTLFLVLACARAIHINDDTANAQGNQPDFSFPSGGNQPAPGGYPGFPGQGGFPGQNGQGGFPGQNGQGGFPGDNGQGGFPGQNGQGGFPGQNGQGGFPGNQGPQNGNSNNGQFSVNVDLSSIPTADVALINALWALYQDLLAPNAQLNLIYAAKLPNYDGSVAWRLVYQLVGPNWGVTYIAVQLTNQNNKWTHQHIFFTHTLNEVIYLWNLPASTSFNNLNVQGLLQSIIANNPFANLNKDSIQQAIDAANAQSSTTIQQLQADKAALQAQIDDLNNQLMALRNGQPNNNNGGWRRDRDPRQGGDDNNGRSGRGNNNYPGQNAPSQPNQINTNGAIIGQNGRVQFPNSILNIGAQRRDDLSA